MNENGDPAWWTQPDEPKAQHRRRGLTACKPLAEDTTAGDMDTPYLGGTTEIDGEYTNIVVTKENHYESGHFGQGQA